jgi:DNA-binding transcriptional regulator LsrR (DeoR family)
LDQRTISLTIEDIRKLDRVVVVVGGRRKFEAIAAALRGRIPDVLVTDSKTANRLLKMRMLQPNL